MDTTGYCKLCGQIKRHFCCQTCYEADATKSESKKEMSRTIADLEAANIAQARTITEQVVIIREHQAADVIAVEAIRSQAEEIIRLKDYINYLEKAHG
jgi:hypothetical protein